MDLFLDNTYQSLYVELLAKYTKLAQRKHVNVLKLSSSLKSVSEGLIKIPTVPMLTDLSGKSYSSALSITYYLTELMMIKDVLVGRTKQDELQIISLFELCERKRPQDLFKQFNDHFLHNTFAAKQTLTVGDLLLFAFFNDALINEKDRLQYPSLLRWYIHIQNLSGVKDFLIDTNSTFINLP